MRRFARLAALGPALLIGATLATATPAAAATEGVTTPPPGDVFSWWPWQPEYSPRRTLTLTISESWQSYDQPDRRVQLVCSPRHSGHPNAWSACIQLARANGNPAYLRPTWGLACTREYNPVTVTANGVWDGNYIRYQRTFANSCTLNATTGSVYRF
ncbi:SSI family serine proteinase inhibitor [Streptosporangium soli]|nr:subtilase-type protease inhibitor [Streptosporangium sp. KLBMP 9127]